MQKEQVKLVKSENGKEEFYILINKKVGEGAFGTVYEARSSNCPEQKLVAKIIKINSQQKIKAIEKELKIMSEIPLHPNIVRVIPLKTYSTNYYYIFMEYCNEGTLEDLLFSKKTAWKESELYDIFYQCMNGYKVLFDKKILHQDIKPGNILLKNGTYKLADFGLSLFYEGHDFGLSREGTLLYIPPEKLTIKNYVGNPKSDVYAFGVMFFKMITGVYPYIQSYEKGNLNKSIKQLCDIRLQNTTHVRGKYSLRFESFFDLILLMVKKVENSRISFEQIYEIIQSNQIFQESRKKQKQLTKQYFCAEYDFVITQFTNILTLPFNISAEEEEEQRKKFDIAVKEKELNLIETGKEIANYFIRSRLIVYYLDRLARKLIVQEAKMGEKNQLYERVILYLMLLIKSLNRGLVDELISQKKYSVQNYICFKRTHQLAQQIINLLKKDYDYIKDCLEEILSQQPCIPKQQVKKILQLQKQNNQTDIVKNLSGHLKELLASKTTLIQVSNKTHLLTLANILMIDQFIENFDRCLVDVEKLEASDKKIMMSSTPELIGMIENLCSQKGLICGFDMTGAYEDEESIVFES